MNSNRNGCDRQKCLIFIVIPLLKLENIELAVLFLYDFSLYECKVQNQGKSEFGVYDYIAIRLKDSLLRKCK